MFDAGYIYFMFSPRSFLFKIGKGKDFQRRKKQIDDSIPGELTCVYKAYLIGKSAYEKELHRRYDSRRVVWKGSGKTEYFKLNPFQVVWIIIQMVLFQLGQLAALLIVITSILYYLKFVL